MSAPLHRVIVVGDSTGVPELLERVPADRVVAVVAADIRPQSHDALRQLAEAMRVSLLIQPRATSPEYPNFVAALAALAPDGLICHSYSMRLRADVLALVHGRAFNVHLALLPRNRGPNPVQWALIHGDATTGATLHLMDEEFDRGPIVDQESIVIEDSDTWPSLLDRARAAGRRLLDRAIPRLLDGQWSARAQSEQHAVINSRIPRDSFAIDFRLMSDQQVVNLVRAQVAPLGGAYLDTLRGRVRFTAPLTRADVAELRRQHAD